MCAATPARARGGDGDGPRSGDGRAGTGGRARASHLRRARAGREARRALVAVAVLRVLHRVGQKDVEAEEADELLGGGAVAVEELVEQPLKHRAALGDDGGADRARAGRRDGRRLEDAHPAREHLRLRRVVPLHQVDERREPAVDDVGAQLALAHERDVELVQRVRRVDVAVLDVGRADHRVDAGEGVVRCGRRRGGRWFCARGHS